MEREQVKLVQAEGHPTVRMYEGPDASSPVRCFIPCQSEGEICEDQGSWLKVKVVVVGWIGAKNAVCQPQRMKLVPVRESGKDLTPRKIKGEGKGYEASRPATLHATLQGHDIPTQGASVQEETITEEDKTKAKLGTLKYFRDKAEARKALEEDANLPMDLNTDKLQAMASEIFEAYDRDGDGSLSLAETLTVLPELEPSLGEQWWTGWEPYACMHFSWKEFCEKNKLDMDKGLSKEFWVAMLCAQLSQQRGIKRISHQLLVSLHSMSADPFQYSKRALDFATHISVAVKQDDAYKSYGLHEGLEREAFSVLWSSLGFQDEFLDSYFAAIAGHKAKISGKDLCHGLIACSGIDADATSEMILRVFDPACKGFLDRDGFQMICSCSVRAMMRIAEILLKSGFCRLQQAMHLLSLALEFMQGASIEEAYENFKAGKEFECDFERIFAKLDIDDDGKVTSADLRTAIENSRGRVFTGHCDGDLFANNMGLGKSPWKLFFPNLAINEAVTIIYYHEWSEGFSKAMSRAL